jgi:hypothetical protein
MFVLAQMQQRRRIPMVRADGPAVESQPALELTLRARDIPRPVELDEGQRGVRVGESLIQRDGTLGRRPGARIGFVGRHQRVFAEKVVTVRKADIGLGILGVSRDRRIEIVHGAIEAFRRALFPMIEARQVEFGGLRGGAMLASALRRWGCRHTCVTREGQHCRRPKTQQNENRCRHKGRIPIPRR